MYNFNSDEELKKQFFQEIENSSVQKISGKITRIDGEIIYLGEKNLLDDVSINYQCTSDENIFNFGEMYVGSAEIMVNLSEEDVNLVKGGELQLSFSLQDIFNKRIPMGVWDIVSAERDTNGIVKIKGYDHLNRLNAPVTDNTIGAIYMKSALKQVSKDAKVEFAQTVEELQEIFGDTIQSFASSFYSSCWNEVKAIAQFLGCFVLANREGKIEFRKFSSTPVLDIPAEKRFSLKLNDYIYSVKGISYKDSYGNTVARIGDAENYAVIELTDNKYIWEAYDSEQAEKQYGSTLQRLADMFSELGNWSTGEIEYYGNPALDVGDMVRIVGGTYNDSKFLITSISWQFRAPQILISAGVPETSTTVSSGSYGGSESVTSYTTINTTNNISAINLKTYLGEFFAEKIIAKGNFSCVHETWIFINVNTVIKGNTTFTSIVHIDGIQQNLQPVQTVNGYATVDFSLPVKVNGGKHTIEISANGTAEIEQIQAIVWGQELKEEMPDITEDSDYTYTIKNSLTTVTGYKGVNLYPSIPDDLGGGKTAVIGYGAFSGTKIKNCYIPDGVTEIK